MSFGRKVRVGVLDGYTWPTGRYMERKQRLIHEVNIIKVRNRQNHRCVPSQAPGPTGPHPNHLPVLLPQAVVRK